MNAVSNVGIQTHDLFNSESPPITTSRLPPPRNVLLSRY